MWMIEELLFDWVPIILMEIKLFICGKSRIVSEIKIIDWNREGWYNKPRWDIHITFKRSSTNKLESAFMNRWFSKKSRYKNIRIVIFREQ